MREIKFRGWHSATNEMYLAERFSTEHLYISSLGSVVFGDDKLVVHESNWVLMQYTGLKDKNGKEIYEGDVLSSPHFADATGRNHTLKHSVEWSERFHGWFLLSCSSKDPDDGSIQMFVAKKCGEISVIGNIHDNPELLTKRD